MKAFKNIRGYVLECWRTKISEKNNNVEPILSLGFKVLMMPQIVIFSPLLRSVGTLLISMQNQAVRVNRYERLTGRHTERQTANTFLLHQGNLIRTCQREHTADWEQRSLLCLSVPSIFYILLEVFSGLNITLGNVGYVNTFRCWELSSILDIMLRASFSPTLKHMK